MKSIMLLPYSPWPPNTGAKIEMMKHLGVLRELGPCCIASARSKPVGAGWTDAAVNALKEEGFELVFREDTRRRNLHHLFGIGYAVLMTVLRLERGFGHPNPYHRYAFSSDWWHELTKGKDLAVHQYTFWARFPAACPQVVVVQELLSNFHFGGSHRETEELRNADLLITVGKDEEEVLRERGLCNVLWSPPAVASADFPVTSEIGLIGTKAPQNLEGLRWLESGMTSSSPKVYVYGNIAEETKASSLIRVGRYEDQYTPYQACGIHLMTRSDRPGLQIKVVEALACGRAIVARRGSMRGVPHEKGVWMEVNSPDEMLKAAEYLQKNAQERERLAAAAKGFYKKNLSSDKILKDLREAYLSLAGFNHDR